MTENVKLSIAMRMARAALNWTQHDVACETGIAKTVIARAELIDGNLNLGQVARLLNMFKENGVELNFLFGRVVTVTVDETAIEAVREDLMDIDGRRADRRAPITGGKK
jgi:transcriptional regulator with XRE-family HTH domain